MNLRLPMTPPKQSWRWNEKMAKIVEVKKCLDCPYQRGVNECDHPNLVNLISKGETASKFRIDNLKSIPDWCPLPDYEEVKGGKE